MKSKDRTNISILRSNDICFLGILRCAGYERIPYTSMVYDYNDAKPWYSESSNFFKNVNLIANPFDDEQKAVADLVRIGKNHVQTYGCRSFLVPSSDTNLMLIQQHFSKLSEYYMQIGSVDFSSPRLDVIDKENCCALLSQAGIQVPRTIGMKNIEDLSNLCCSPSSPVIVKPSVKDYGQTFYQQNNQHKAIECTSYDELKAVIEKQIARGHKIIAQEKLSCQSIYDEIPFYAYVDANHDIRMAATAIKEKVYPEPYGTAIQLRLSWHDELFKQAQAIAKALRWRGLLMIEFMKHACDKKWYVIEVNTRPWLLIDFFRQSGLNFIKALYDDFQDGMQHHPQLRIPHKEVMATNPVHINLYESLHHDASVCDKSLNQWLMSIKGSTSFVYYDRNDPSPFLSQIKAMYSAHGSVRSQELNSNIAQR